MQNQSDFNCFEKAPKRWRFVNLYMGSNAYHLLAIWEVRIIFLFLFCVQHFSFSLKNQILKTYAASRITESMQSLY